MRMSGRYEEADNPRVIPKVKAFPGAYTFCLYERQASQYSCVHGGTKKTCEIFRISQVVLNYGNWLHRVKAAVDYQLGPVAEGGLV
jgi:hypothetical protein